MRNYRRIFEILDMAFEQAVKWQLYERNKNQVCDPQQEVLADPYAESGVIPIRAYLENGWWWPCAGEACARMVALDDLGGMDENGEPLCVPCASQAGLTPPDWARPHTPVRGGCLGRAPRSPSGLPGPTRSMRDMRGCHGAVSSQGIGGTGTGTGGGRGCS